VASSYGPSSSINLEVADVDSARLDSVDVESKQTDEVRAGVETASWLYRHSTVLRIDLVHGHSLVIPHYHRVLQQPSHNNAAQSTGHRNFNFQDLLFQCPDFYLTHIHSLIMSPGGLNGHSRKSERQQGRPAWRWMDGWMTF